jgi:hypothetical protein
MNAKTATLRFLVSCCSLGTAALLLFFLAASAPHRVHHLFEQGKSAPAAHSSAAGHDHHKDPHSDSTPAQCVLQAVAQNVHARSIPVLEVPFCETAVTRVFDPLIRTISYFDTSPFSPRAPPRA